MLPDAATAAELARLEHVNEVLRWTVVVAGAAAFCIACVVSWLEAKLEGGCPHCSHCLHQQKERARKQSDAQNAYEHRMHMHEKDCPCQEGGPPRPRA